MENKAIRCFSKYVSLPEPVNYVLKLKRTLSALILVMSITLAFSQDLTQTDSVSAQKEKKELNRRHSIGSTFFLLGNLDREEPPAFFQLNYGYQFTPKNVIVVEAITWTVYEPIGIPYGSSGESYPGKIKSYGIGVGYQHFYWKGLYTTVQATPFFQHYLDTEDEKIQNGFQLFLQLRLGYRIDFYKQRLFIEPSVVCNYWPINTNVPASFAEIESEWPNYFLFEPGLHFGFRF